METEYLYIASTILFFVISAWLGYDKYKSGKKVDADIFLKGAGIARTIVAASEQLWMTGKLEKSARFDWVAERIRKVLPNVTDEDIVTFIEGGVGLLKSKQTEIQ